MAVFTKVSFDEAAAFLRIFELGDLRSIQACTGGIENTNYFVDTEIGAYVLTLFERLASDELPFYVHLMQHLAHCGIPVPDPVPDGKGRLPQRLLSRLRDLHRPREAAVLNAHDPAHFERVLRHRAGVRDLASSASERRTLMRHFPNQEQ